MELQRLPATLCGWESTDVGLLKSATPVVIQTKRGSQYLLNKEAEKGLQPLIDEYIRKGILVECQSPCNTPVLPVRKPKLGKDSKPVYHFVQDLRGINDYVIPRAAVVPNPATIVTSIPRFTVIDLCAAFFSIPVAAQSQYLFAFT